MKTYKTINGNPNYKAISHFINKLESVKESALREGFDIGEPRISCGTPHCVAGWYGVAILEEVKEYIINKEGKLRIYLGYVDALNVLTEIVGVDLTLWADKNSSLWGNDYGNSCFSDSEAYNYEGYLGVIRHWKEVRDRLKEIQQKDKKNGNNKPKNK